MQCSQCGELLEQGAKFCSRCGHRMDKYCPKCGEVIEETVKFCPHCGTKPLPAKAGGFGLAAEAA